MDAHLPRWLVVVSMGLALAGCVADQQTEETETKRANLSVPKGVAYLPFKWNGPYPDAVALTFDDGPDAFGTTDRVLDTLAAWGVTATFFVNSNNACEVATDRECQRVIRRIADEGHTLGNHTARHLDLTTLSSATVRSELSQVDDMLAWLVPDVGAISLVRAPYGAPFVEGPQSQLNRIAPILAEHGVHVGWNIDSADATTCSGDPECVKTTVLSALDAGRRGVILMHAIEPATADALPAILDAINARGLWFTSVEDMVVQRYGQSSASFLP